DDRWPLRRAACRGLAFYTLPWRGRVAANEMSGGGGGQCIHLDSVRVEKSPHPLSHFAALNVSRPSPPRGGSPAQQTYVLRYSLRVLRRLCGHRLGRGAAARLQMEFVGHEMPRCCCRLAVRHGLVAALLDLGDKLVLDAEHHVGVEIFVAV